jgi:hypothetical protein
LDTPVRKYGARSVGRDDQCDKQQKNCHQHRVLILFYFFSLEIFDLKTMGLSAHGLLQLGVFEDCV